MNGAVARLPVSPALLLSVSLRHDVSMRSTLCICFFVTYGPPQPVYQSPGVGFPALTAAALAAAV